MSAYQNKYREKRKNNKIILMILKTMATYSKVELYSLHLKESVDRYLREASNSSIKVGQIAHNVGAKASMRTV